MGVPMACRSCARSAAACAPVADRRRDHSADCLIANRRRRLAKTNVTTITLASCLEVKALLQRRHAAFSMHDSQIASRGHRSYARNFQLQRTVNQYNSALMESLKEHQSGRTPSFSSLTTSTFSTGVRHTFPYLVFAFWFSILQLNVDFQLFRQLFRQFPGCQGSPAKLPNHRAAPRRS